MREVKRFAACIQYDGHAYHGFQCQNHGLPTVQLHLEKAFSQVAGESVGIVCAGRTDAGVHASMQVIHFDTHAIRTERAWQFGANANLPRDISVKWVKPVDIEFHARFKAKARSYRYIIYNSPVRHAILRHAVTWHHYPLDEKRMHEACQTLLGEHDFSAFRSSNCQASSPVRTIHAISVSRHKDFVVLEVTANAFLHHMVRNIVGTLYPIGAQLQPVAWMEEVLEQKNRSKAGVTAAPFGLYLSHVVYDDSWQLPSMPKGPFFITFL